MVGCLTSKEPSMTPRSGISSTRIYPPSQSRLATLKSHYAQCLAESDAGHMEQDKALLIRLFDFV